MNQKDFNDTLNTIRSNGSRYYPYITASQRIRLETLNDLFDIPKKWIIEYYTEIDPISLYKDELDVVNAIFGVNLRITVIGD